MRLLFRVKTSCFNTECSISFVPFKVLSLRGHYFFCKGWNSKGQKHAEFAPDSYHMQSLSAEHLVLQVALMLNKLNILRPFVNASMRLSQGISENTSGFLAAHASFNPAVPLASFSCTQFF